MIGISELQALLARLERQPARELETERLRFRSCPANRDELCRTLAGVVAELANAEGGTVVLGVEPDRGGDTMPNRGPIDAFVGSPGIDLDDLRRRVHQLTRPAILVEACLMPIHDAPESSQVLVVEVPRGLPPHVVVEDWDRRPGLAETLPVPDEDLTARVLDIGEEGIDPLEVERLRNTLQAVSQGGPPESGWRKPQPPEKPSDLLRLDNLGLLRALGILAPDQATPKLTVAGLLLVGREARIAQKLPGHEAVYLHMTRETEYDRRADSRKSLLALLEDLARQIEAHNRLFTLKVGLFHFELPDYPAEVYREALLNAFMHRDYARLNPVYVRLYAERMEIANPGGFLGGITADNIMSHEPVTRNRLLAEILQRLRLVERSGLGVRRMFTIMLASGKEPPLYVATPEDVRVVLRSGKTDEPFARFVTKRQQQGEEFKLNELIVLAYLKRNQEIDLHEATRILQRSSTEAHEALGAMVERRLLEPFGQKKGRVYRLSRAVYVELRQSVEYYLHRDAEAAYAEAAITNYIRTSDAITNKVVRTLLRVNKSQSSYLLHRLVTSGKLVMVGRGKKSQYVLPRPESREPGSAKGNR